MTGNRGAVAIAVAIAAWAFSSGCSIPAEPGEFECSYYAAPTKAGGGTIPEGGAWGSKHSFTSSFDSPGTVAGFWQLALPGDVLCLRSGTYRGELSMLRPPRGFGGEPGKPIQVHALEDGEVWFDGEHERQTVAFMGPHWIATGFNAYNSRVGILTIDGRTTPAKHIVVKRVVVWRDPNDAHRNSKNVDISFAADVLLEDVGCFGHARKCIQVHRSARVTNRRVWARWDGRFPHEGGNQFAISAMYGSFDSLVENVLATSGGVDQTGHTPPDYTAEIFLFGTDPIPRAEDIARWAPGRDGHDVKLRTLGSIAYSGPDQRFDSSGLMMTREGVKGSVLRDVAVSVPASSRRVLLNHVCDKNVLDCIWSPGDTRNTATQLTLIGGPPKVPTKLKLGEWQASHIQTFDVQQPVDIFTPDGEGASICNRYVDGRLTDQPLWPWPMNERILAATRRSGWGEADVTADIEKIFGPIPAVCRAGD